MELCRSWWRVTSVCGQLSVSDVIFVTGQIFYVAVLRKVVPVDFADIATQLFLETAILYIYVYRFTHSSNTQHAHTQTHVYSVDA